MGVAISTSVYHSALRHYLTTTTDNDSETTVGRQAGRCVAVVVRFFAPVDEQQFSAGRRLVPFPRLPRTGGHDFRWVRFCSRAVSNAFSNCPPHVLPNTPRMEVLPKPKSVEGPSWYMHFHHPGELILFLRSNIYFSSLTMKKKKIMRPPMFMCTRG